MKHNNSDSKDFKDKVRQLKHRAFECLMFSNCVKKVTNSVYRSLHAEYREEAIENARHLEGQDIIGFNLSYVTFLEHLADAIGACNASGNFRPIYVCSTRTPARKYKESTLRNLDSHGISFGRDLFEYPFLKHLNVRAFVEVAVSGYGADLACPRIMYTHGMGGLNFSKDFYYVNYLSSYSAIFMNGPLQKRALLIAQKKYKCKLPELYEIGYLRGDRLRAKSVSFDKVTFREGLGLPDLPMVLYAPTWGVFSSTDEWLDKISHVCERIGVNLLLRLHPIMFTSDSVYETGGIDWKSRLDTLQKKHRNLRLANSLEIDELMLSADVMITDVSGLAIEFLALEKPAIFLPADLYFELYGEERPEKWCRPGACISNVQQLEHEINNALKGRGFLYPIEKLIYNKNHSSQAFLNGISDLI